MFLFAIKKKKKTVYECFFSITSIVYVNKNIGDRQKKSMKPLQKSYILSSTEDNILMWIRPTGGIGHTDGLCSLIRYFFH